MLSRYLLILATLLAFFAFAGWAGAGDKLTGASSYTMLNRDGSYAGHASTNLDGTQVDYHPGDGGPTITYVWAPAYKRYENAERGDYFTFYFWPQRYWEHGYVGASGTTTGPYSNDPGLIEVDPLPTGS